MTASLRSKLGIRHLNEFFLAPLRIELGLHAEGEFFPILFLPQVDAVALHERVDFEAFPLAAFGLTTAPAGCIVS